ncbi:response regulator receiver domain-containing protein [Celeribacter persicus]|uniref:Response regulator receiver domain-containing protein n=2 Tax=Celeribacter persicus TaxID=1651082 RepID=A0A2T5HT92_9RHOB|nr:response regulator receiver domain-containing protein [Celeribacter persicus]
MLAAEAGGRRNMQVLIVESSPDIGRVWQRHLERQGMCVTLVAGQDEAIESLQNSAPDLIVLDLVLEQGSAFAVADYANYRHPDTRVIFTTNSSFFSDGSIFQHVANACAFLPKKVDLEDLTAMVEHYGKDSALSEVKRVRAARRS